MNKKKLLSIVCFGFIVLLLFSLTGCGKPKITWTPSDPSQNRTNPQLKVYLENSGSMDGYMCQGSELKDAIYGYVSSLSSNVDSVQLNYINTEIIPYHNNLESFIRDLNPAVFAKAGGDRGNSDIAAMLRSILNKTDDKTISIFVSDCILDVPDGSAENYFINRQIEIRNAFTQALKRNPDLGVEIFRMESNFNGIYYYSSGHERLTDHERPYYMFIVGNKHILADINRKVSFSSIPHGIEDYYAYTSTCEVPFEITNQYGIGNPKGTECSNGEFRVNVDLSATLQQDDVLNETKNYKNQSPFIRLKEISGIKDRNSAYTHVLTYSIRNNVKPMAELVILSQSSLPDWIDEANDDTGANVTSHLKQTTGIKYIINGIADAYNNTPLATFKFVISK